MRAATSPRHDTPLGYRLSPPRRWLRESAHVHIVHGRAGLMHTDVADGASGRVRVLGPATIPRGLPASPRHVHAQANVARRSLRRTIGGQAGGPASQSRRRRRRQRGNGCVLLLVARPRRTRFSFPRFPASSRSRSLSVPLSLVPSLYPTPAESRQYKPSNITAGRAVR